MVKKNGNGTAVVDATPHTMSAQVAAKVAKEKVAANTRAVKDADNVQKADKAATAAFRAKPVTEKLSSFLRDLPSTIRKRVEDATSHAADMVRGFARNAFAWAESALAVKEAMTEKQFAFWIGEVLPSFGLPRSTAYKYLNNARVLVTAITYAPAREALLAITNGRGIFESVDGDVRLTAACITAFKKYPIPSAPATYEDCLDWSRHVAVALEKTRPGRSAGTYLKTIRAAFKTLLHGNARTKTAANPSYAVVACVELFRTLQAASEPLTAAATAGIEDAALDINAIQQMAIESMTGGQKSGKKTVPAIAA